ncbi:unnamed protein product [Porites lobata]|uniref:DZIP3-like HEPN domain-containing protein n=1 Tax=Porites lobata TaxID=104759 RepID=A0ABN8Q5C3_9CNID|nr:unnamed protein product [Porites lobata]
MSSVFESSEEKTNGTKLARLVIDGGTHALRTFLNTFHPPGVLQAALASNFGKLHVLKSKRGIFDSQWESLFPSSGDPPDSETFDITLLHLLLREICYLAPPSTGWNNLPLDSDVSPEAHIVRIKCFRNELCHSISTGVTNVEFEDKWNKISESLVALGLDQKEIDLLKTKPIDHDTESRVKAEVERWTRDFETQIQILEQELANCLPDEIPDVFGRSEEIRQVTEAIQFQRVDTVVITGGPGFVAHELVANHHCKNTVLYCPIRSKTTVDDVATSMILTCNKNHSHPPQNPHHWLLNWSKQQMNHVTFILDNADDILNSDDRLHFINLLRDMRILSGQNVDFLVTSRRVFKDSSLKMIEVRLKALALEESRRVLTAQVSDDCIKKQLSKTDILIELCGCVPLAICIVGSLLSDYTEDELINSLKESPLDVLREDESDDNSVKKAIKTSHDVLSDIEQQVLVVMSAFLGSFSSEAAKTVISKCMSCISQPMSILRSLKNRSLIEQPASQRYQIHPLIQAFLKTIDQEVGTQLVISGQREACAYFISQLADNADLYWTNDMCKESIQRFNKDRHNFEYFLKACISGLKNEDPDVLAVMETLVERISQISSIYLYLEMCLLPSVYVEFLKLSCDLLTSGHHPSTRRVELLCLVGHESRRAGDLNKYKEFQEKAREAHLQNPAEFEGEKVSEAFFHNNNARFLAEEGKLDEAKEQFDLCLNICEENLSLDYMYVQKAITLLFAGYEDNRRNERCKAEQKLNEALDLYQRVLGKHVMTAWAERKLADFHLFHGDGSLGTVEDQQKCIELYGDALTIMESLGMAGHKECILSLTNLGICHQLQGNQEQAMKLYQGALNIAERELGENHKWKVYLKTQMAYWNKEKGNLDEAKALKEEAVHMSDTLGLPVNQPRNKFLLQKI